MSGNEPKHWYSPTPDEICVVVSDATEHTEKKGLMDTGDFLSGLCGFVVNILFPFLHRTLGFWRAGMSR
jgi:hypothetical protein